MLWKLYEGRVPAGADLVCYWFEKARDRVANGATKRVGFLSTNSIRGGVNRKVLQRIKETGDIFFAESDRPWILNGAAVRVSMVGFDDGSEADKALDGAPVATIYTDLTGDLDLSAARKLEENRGICFFSIKKGGPFDVPGEVARRWLALPTNPNGRPNSDVVRPWYNGLDVARRPRDMWIVDFGTETTEEEAALYEAPFEYVRTHVKPIRAENRRERRRRLWWLFSETAPGMRRGIENLPRFLVTPAVSTHHILAWLDQKIVPDQQLIVFARADDYSFGVLHSRAHELWATKMGTWMGVGNDPRYTPTTCFETFPFPEPTEEQRDAIAGAAKRLDDLRRNWLNPEGTSEAELKRRTLTNLYNARPTWLINAHAALDRAVYVAYGWSENPEEMNEEELLGRLLSLNTRQAAEAASA